MANQINKQPTEKSQHRRENEIATHRVYLQAQKRRLRNAGNAIWTSGQANPVVKKAEEYDLKAERGQHKIVTPKS